MKQILLTLLFTMSAIAIYNCEYIAFHIESKATQLFQAQTDSTGKMISKAVAPPKKYYSHLEEYYLDLLPVQLVSIYMETEFDGQDPTWNAELLQTEKHQWSSTNFFSMHSLDALLEDIHHHYRINQGCYSKTDLDLVIQ